MYINELTGQKSVMVLTERLWLILPALAVWVLSCWQTVFLCHLAYLFISLTFTVEEADGLSLGYTFLTPQGLAASITNMFGGACKPVLFNLWHTNTIKAEKLRTTSLSNEAICMCVYTCIWLPAFTLKSPRWLHLKASWGFIFSLKSWMKD